jgi:dinuclear metal center YbgI/SA1388 family protein
MTWTVGDIINKIEELAPGKLAEAWDNVGLQVGSREWPVKKVWVALDPLAHVVEAARRAHVDMLITHHPLIFKPLKSIDCATPAGDIIQSALRHGMAIFSAHTNLDSAAGGVNDSLAQHIGLCNLAVLKQEEHEKPDTGCRGPSVVQGLGRTGDLPRETTLGSLARELKQRLNLKSVVIAGDATLPVTRVAICSGSGASLLGDFFASDAQVYISGDLRYHDARDVETAERGLIDIGHFASEHLVVDVLAGKLAAMLNKNGADISVEACRLEEDPFKTIL